MRNLGWQSIFSKENPDIFLLLPRDAPHDETLFSEDKMSGEFEDLSPQHSSTE